MRMKRLLDLNPREKRVLVRVDWNVTRGKAMEIVDDMRIRKTEQTIKWLLKNGVKKIILLAHLGKPKGKESALSLKPIAQYAKEIMGIEIDFCKSFEEGLEMRESKVIMLENLRFWEGEQNNEHKFAKMLSNFGDDYVNEAFGESHRKVASIVGIPDYLPSFAGLWLERETEAILRVRENAEHPMVVVMGGAKVEDKLKLIEILSQRAEVILLGGKLANQFVNANLRFTNKAKIYTPIEGSGLLDIGEETQKLYASEIAKAKTVVWNGPMGMVEDVRYQAGTEAVFEAMMSNREAYTMVGGGDTLAAIKKQEHWERIDHISTGGGAMLQLLEKGTLPGIEALKQ